MTQRVEVFAYLYTYELINAGLDTYGRIDWLIDGTIHDRLTDNSESLVT
jgi:hypothetical protein